MRRPCKFTEADVRRALRAAAKEGVRAQIDVLPDGRLSIIPLGETGAATTPVAGDVNEWDEVKP